MNVAPPTCEALIAVFTPTEKEPLMRASLTAIPVVVAALFVGCGQPISPTSPSITSSGGNATSMRISGDVAALRREEVPFKGSGEGVVTRRTPLSPPLVSLLTEGTGNATHLGQFTVDIAHVVNTSAMTVTGSYEFTAANGDTLIADVTGQFGPTLENPRVLLSVETATITGGTGRFAGATGSFTVERLLNLDTFLTTVSFKGTISSPGVGNP
jgi:hypothetical protein